MVDILASCPKRLTITLAMPYSVFNVLFPLPSDGMDFVLIAIGSDPCINSFPLSYVYIINDFCLVCKFAYFFERIHLHKAVKKPRYYGTFLLFKCINFHSKVTFQF